MWPGAEVAKQGAPEPTSTSWDVWIAIAALAALVALGSWAIYRVKRWREELAANTVDQTPDTLAHYQQMMDDGLLDPEEFDRIKARLESAALSNEESPPPQPPDTAIKEP